MEQYGTKIINIISLLSKIPRLEGKEVYVDEQFQNDMTNTKIEVCMDFSGDIEHVVQKNDFIAGDV